MKRNITAYLCLLLAGLTPAAFAQNWMGVHSIFIRPDSLTEAHTGMGNGTYTDNVDDLVANAKAAGVRALYVEMRAAEVSSVNDSEVGHLYFQADPHPDIVAAAAQTFVSSFGESFGANDSFFVRYLIDEAHAAGLQVYADFPTFLDTLLWEQGSVYRSQPECCEDGFVSVVDPAVRNHQLELIRQIVTRFPFDGINLDYIRYQIEEQPQGSAADSQFNNLYGVSISDPAQNGRGSQYWDEYLAFRADALISFIEEVRDMANALRPMEIGGFMMPHSAKTAGVDGYPDNPWAGVDYDKMAALGLNLMPMVYWGDDLNWYLPGTKDDFTDAVTANVLGHAQNHPGAQAVPTYSLVYPESEVINALQIARDNGVYDLSFYFPGDWGSPIDTPMQDLTDALLALNGDANLPTLNITGPASPEVDPSQPLNITATASTNVAQAFYRFDGGTWQAMSINGANVSANSVDISGLAAGRHTLTVLVRDANGRPAQDVLLLNQILIFGDGFESGDTSVWSSGR